MPQALDGLKVLDFCWVAVGPMTTRYLAEYGATVVRVESRGRPEVLRLAAPYKDGVAGIDRSGYFANMNSNKYGVAISMRHPRARDLVLRMAKWADVVTENFTPGTMENWGLGYEDLAEANPGVIMFSTSMMGRGGPLDRQPGFGPVLSSLVGLTGTTGWPDREPVNPYGAYTDFIVPRFAVASILAAVDYRRRTGKGLHLDMSQLEASIHFSAPFMLDRAVNGREQGLKGNRHAAMAPHGAYPCRGEDRWVAITCRNDGEWEDLRRVLDPSGQGELFQDCFASLLGRKAREDDLDRVIGGHTRAWERRDLMEALQERGVPAGVVNDPRDLFEDPQLQHRRHFAYPDHPEIGPYATDQTEARLSRTPGRLDQPAPRLGEHTEFVLTEMMGLSTEEYRSLKDDGALE